MDVQEFLRSLSEAELWAWMDEAGEDCRRAARIEWNGEEHQQAFAALLGLCMEANRRGIWRHQLH